MFFRVQVLQGPGFSGSGSRVRVHVQALEVADTMDLKLFYFRVKGLSQRIIRFLFKKIFITQTAHASNKCDLE